MNKSKQSEIWRTCAIEGFDRIQFWTRLIESFIQYQRGSDAAIGIGMRRLSKIMSHTVKHPEFRDAALKDITDWAMANMWKLHVEVSNAFADVYHLRRIKNLASDMVNAVAEIEGMNNE